MRGILPLSPPHIPRRLLRLVRQTDWTVTLDRDFRAVIEGCSEIHPDRPDSWINPKSNACISACRLGVCPFRRGLGRHRTDWRAVWGSSWLSLFWQIYVFTPQQRIETCAGSSDGAAALCGFSLLDAQFRNDHLLQFGLIEIPKQQFQRMLHTALKTHLDWPFIASENIFLLAWHKPKA